jgi:hypothetical protein
MGFGGLKGARATALVAAGAAVAVLLAVCALDCSSDGFGGPGCIEGAQGVAVTVADSQGNLICDATVTAVSSDFAGPIRFTASTSADASCFYRTFDGSSGTHYDVTAQAPGFQQNTVDGVTAIPAHDCSQTAFVTVVLSPSTP